VEYVRSAYPNSITSLFIFITIQSQRMHPKGEIGAKQIVNLDWT